MVFKSFSIDLKLWLEVRRTKPLPHGKMLDLWIAETHKKRGVPLDVVDLKVAYHLEFDKKADGFEILKLKRMEELLTKKTFLNEIYLNHES